MESSRSLLRVSDFHESCQDWGSVLSPRTSARFPSCGKVGTSYASSISPSHVSQRGPSARFTRRGAKAGPSVSALRAGARDGSRASGSRGHWGQMQNGGPTRTPGAGTWGCPQRRRRHPQAQAALLCAPGRLREGFPRSVRAPPCPTAGGPPPTHRLFQPRGHDWKLETPPPVAELQL